MVEPLDSRNLVKHIANDRLGDFCLLCLIPLEDNSFESIFTLICREDAEYCVADALKAVCQFELHRSENYNVCIDCFKSASQAYKFHLQAKRSMEIITHFTQELLNNVTNIEITSADMEKLLFIPLSEYTPKTSLFEFNLDGVHRTADNRLENDKYNISNEIEDSMGKEISVNDSIVDNINDNHLNKIDTQADDNLTEMSQIDDNDDDFETETGEVKTSEENIILVVEKERTPSPDGNSDDLSMHSSDEDMVMIVNEKKVRKKRDPMAYMSCSQCPIKYRFVSKLKVHMKTAHDIDLYYCKICKILTEDKEKYEEHLKIHLGKHQCTICNIVYKKAETLVAHMKLHENEKEFKQLDNANICEQCGAILPDEASLEQHAAARHVQRYTCFYCGRRYRGEGSFERHIRKHEQCSDKKQRPNPEESSSERTEGRRRAVCHACGKDFVDERALLWHQRLRHSTDRPYACEVCGRGFVSKNRRNQHSLCAHTPPQHRCPLCPALFHLRSMVNTHVKKVHLTTHKRRNRTSKHRHVYWRTQPVPVQELSVDVQQDVLELSAALRDKPEPAKVKPTMFLHRYSNLEPTITQPARSDETS